MSFQNQIVPLRTDQEKILNKVVELVEHPNSTANNIFFVSGRAGTGKTFLFNRIYKILTDQQRKVVNVASTDVAASLLINGMTARKQLMIPDEFRQRTQYYIRGTVYTDRLEEADLIIWDDVTVHSAQQIEFVDEALRNLSMDDRPFAGIPILFGGDVAQWLPEPDGDVNKVMWKTVCSSLVWELRIQMKLKGNMRLDTRILEERKFANYLEFLAHNDRFVGVPDEIAMARDIDDLCRFVFPDNLLEDPDRHREVASRAVIVSSINFLREIDNSVFPRFPGAARIYRCQDDPAHKAANPEAPDFPDREVVLKVGIPVILLKTLDEEEGLYYGTRLTVECMGEISIDARIATGRFQGQTRTIPKQSFTSEISGLTRTQLPVRPCFGITYQEAQGQFLNVVGIDYRGMSNKHGAFYVALSIATSVHRVAIYADEDDTVKNYIYPTSKYYILGVH